jgi:hypothetical protein
MCNQAWWYDMFMILNWDPKIGEAI